MHCNPWAIQPCAIKLIENNLYKFNLFGFYKHLPIVRVLALPMPLSSASRHGNNNNNHDADDDNSNNEEEAGEEEWFWREKGARGD
jgi:hypothetical protein